MHMNQRGSAGALLVSAGVPQPQELCSFYQTNSTVWKRLYDLTAAQKKILTDGLSKCGMNVTSSKVIPSLGQLSCFFADLVEKMDSNSREALNNALPNCTRNVKDIYQKLLKYIDFKNLTSDTLKSLGKAATGLNRDQIVSLSPSVVNQSLESLGKLKGWSMQQRRSLVKKVNITEQEIPKLGALMAGFSVGVLQKFKGKDILKAFNSSDDALESAKNMSKVQSKAIVAQILHQLSP
ncbi:otoancorin-like [Lissotriton helveticus]